VKNWKYEDNIRKKQKQNRKEEYKHKPRNQTRAKDALPNIDGTQATVSIHTRHPGGHRMDTSAVRILQHTTHALQCIVNEVFRFFVPGDLDL